MISHASESIILTVLLPIRKAKAQSRNECPVAKNVQKFNIYYDFTLLRMNYPGVKRFQMQEFLGQ